jgi:hypothetical protein
VNLKLLSLVLLFVFLSGCGPTREPGALFPGEVTPSMFSQVVKVTGKVSLAVENPMGQGGMYAQLEGGGGMVGVRVQDDVWLPMAAVDKARFREGETLTVKGVLFQVGKEVVVIHGRMSL